jgi:hypothetical protein
MIACHARNRTLFAIIDRRAVSARDLAGVVVSEWP